MKKFGIFALLSVVVFQLMVNKANAQATDSTINFGVVAVNADPRLNILESRIAEYNTSGLADKKVTRTGWVFTSGYRLMVLNTSDRDLLMQVRTKLLQMFPDQQPYVIFQAPFIKLKFGDFLSKPEAERAKKQIQAIHLVPNNIYVLPETVRVRAERLITDDSAKDK